MQLRIAQPGEHDPSRETAEYLNSLASVVYSDVWMNKGAMLARVVVDEHAMISGADLQQACLNGLGAQNTPRMIMVERLYQKAA